MEEDDGETLRALGVDYPEKKKSYRRAWIAGAASLAASIAVVLVCVFTLYPFDAQTNKFLEDNFVTENSTVEKMNTELHDFSLTIDDEACQINVARTYDSISGKAMYYKLAINRYDDTLHYNLVVTCNAHYQYSDFTFSKATIHETLPQYSITYQIDSTVNPQFGFETISCKAEIKGKTDSIYITKYEELILDDHTFLDSVQTFIHATEK